MTSLERAAGLTAALSLALCSAAYAEGVQNKASMKVLASLQHACGEVRYEIPIKGLRAEDETALRDILSFLHDEAKALFTYPGAPKPAPNRKSRQMIFKSDELKAVFKEKNLVKPTTAQMHEEVDKLYESDPSAWNVNQGPSHERLRQILADARFAKRLGEPGRKMIEQRMAAGLGHRREIIEELSKAFGLREVNALQIYEACEVNDDFGPE